MNPPPPYTQSPHPTIPPTPSTPAADRCLASGAAANLDAALIFAFKRWVLPFAAVTEPLRSLMCACVPVRAHECVCHLLTGVPVDELQMVSDGSTGSAIIFFFCSDLTTAITGTFNSFELIIFLPLGASLYQCHVSFDLWPSERLVEYQVAWKLHTLVLYNGVSLWTTFDQQCW